MDSYASFTFIPSITFQLCSLEANKSLYSGDDKHTIDGFDGDQMLVTFLIDFCNFQFRRSGNWLDRLAQIPTHYTIFEGMECQVTSSLAKPISLIVDP